MLLLALAATLLMALAPVVSRWMQAGQGTHATMGHAWPAMAMPAEMRADPHAMDAHAGHGAAHDTADKALPADPHAAHGEACAYCTMASRLLPWLAVLLVLAPLPYRTAPQPPRATVFTAGLRWPAHPARGPPLFS